MTRTLALLAAALLAAALPAADPPKEKTESAAVVVVHARVKGDRLEWFEFSRTPYVHDRRVSETVDGKTVTRAVPEVAYATGVAHHGRPIKGVKATDVDGQAVPAADLAERFKDGGVAVVVTGKVGDDLRKAFAKDVVFIDDSAR
jgi:hypothetical protein